MMLKDHLFDISPERPGFRLHRLEIFNWGTFDSSKGRIYRVEPAGRTALLVGKNGSGKSTIVDAILTLLVPASIRNYNVASGAKQTERSEKSYIRGAYGKGGDDATHSAAINYLRAKPGQLSALLAVFRDEHLDRAFTVCQVLYLSGDGSAEKVFSLADESRELGHDIAELQNSDAIRSHLQRLGYQTTKTFNEYDGWIRKRTNMRAKAMDMFNQTVAVKDIRSLNLFIRSHMLESHNWREKVERLLSHFADLSAAHQELVRAQLAQRLLAPVEEFGLRYRERAGKLASLERRSRAAGLFFAVETVRLCEPEITREISELEAALATRDRLASEARSVGETIRNLKNDIDAAGGQRLRDIPRLIEIEQAAMAPKREKSLRYHTQLEFCGISDIAANPEDFRNFRLKLQGDLEATGQRQQNAEVQLDELVVRRGLLSRELSEERVELEVLQRRQTNLPSHLSELRSQLCGDLGIPESAVPFAAELIAVDPEERRWEPSIEMVMRSFALSLLAPEKLCHRIRLYVEQSRMRNARGEGQRLVYLRVGRAIEDVAAGDRLHPQSMLRKLTFRPGHDLAPWLRAEVQRRFDYRCCDSIEQFHDEARLAMTEKRHIKAGSDRHEKDDRPRALDPRNYVLGWDNREKRRRLAEHIGSMETELNVLGASHASLRSAIEALRVRRLSAMEALNVPDFDAIDYRRHEESIAALRREESELETANEAVKTLKRSLLKAEAAAARIEDDREEAIGRARSLQESIERSESIVKNSREMVARARTNGEYEIHSPSFSLIAAEFVEPPLSIDNLFVREKRWPDETRTSIERLRGEIKPLSDDLRKAMEKYLREFRESQADLDSDIESLESFLQLLHQIREEDLPKHERRFKDRLNDKVSQEVAMLNIELNEERKRIEEKIRQLNLALAELDYQQETAQQSATHMRLEPRDVADREITDFRSSLRACLDDSLENTEEANEARFLRIKKFVERLSDKENARWRDKVIDVRNWCDFAAREVQNSDGKTRGYYEDSAGQSGGEKAKLAFTILVAAIAYQYDLDPAARTPGRFHFVVVDEMFSKVDDQNALYALRLFRRFGLQLLIVAPLDAKARVTESFVDCYLHAVKDEASHHSELYSMTAREWEEVTNEFQASGAALTHRRAAAK